MTALRAAAHELRCRECRVTWRSWAARLLHVGGTTPRVRCSVCRKRYTGVDLIVSHPGADPACWACAGVTDYCSACLNPIIGVAFAAPGGDLMHVGCATEEP